MRSIRSLSSGLISSAGASSRTSAVKTSFTTQRPASSTIKHLLEIPSDDSKKFLQRMRQLSLSKTAEPALLRAASAHFYSIVDSYYPREVAEILGHFADLRYSDAYVVGAFVGRIEDSLPSAERPVLEQLWLLAKSLNVSQTELLTPLTQRTMTVLPNLYGGEVANVLSSMNHLMRYDPQLADLLLLRSLIISDSHHAYQARVIDNFTRGYSRVGLNDNQDKKGGKKQKKNAATETTAAETTALPPHLFELIDKYTTPLMDAGKYDLAAMKGYPLTDAVRMMAANTRIGQLDVAEGVRGAVSAYWTSLSASQRASLAVSVASQLHRSGFVDLTLLEVCAEAAKDATPGEALSILVDLSFVAPQHPALDALWKAETLANHVRNAASPADVRAVVEAATVRKATAKGTANEETFAVSPVAAEAARILAVSWRQLPLSGRRVLADAFAVANHDANVLIAETAFVSADNRKHARLELEAFAVAVSPKAVSLDLPEGDFEEDVLLTDEARGANKALIPSLPPLAPQVGEPFANGTVSIGGQSFLLAEPFPVAPAETLHDVKVKGGLVYLSPRDSITLAGADGVASRLMSPRAETRLAVLAAKKDKVGKIETLWSF